MVPSSSPNRRSYKLKYLTAIILGVTILLAYKADWLSSPMTALDEKPPEPSYQLELIHREDSLKSANLTQQSPAALFVPSEPFEAPKDGVVYLKLTYLDKGYGRLRITTRGPDGKVRHPDRHLNLTRMNTNKVVDALMRFQILETTAEPFAIEVRLERDKDDSLSIEKVTLQDQPFNDEKFKIVNSTPWEDRYTGPSTPPLNNTTLKGKVMVGYQGWFRTPNDPEGRNWTHWGNIWDGTFTVDMWPDVSQYDPKYLEKAAEITTKSGKPAMLFSSAWPSIVNRHFRWMREYEIDGAFLQRFIVQHMNKKAEERSEWVLSNVREAANRNGRIWGIEYDISGCSDGNLLNALKEDWIWFVDNFRGLEDPSYAREGSKPVVFIWGMAVENRNISPETAEAVLDFFKNDPKYGGNYVIGGLPGKWRTLGSKWMDHFKKYDSLLLWMSQQHETNFQIMQEMKIAYYPHVHPGFSWANLKHLPATPETDVKPRDGGLYLWNQISAAAKAGSDRLFIGMFDEYDEATAIMPMSDDPPLPPKKQGLRIRILDPKKNRHSDRKVHIPNINLPLGKKLPDNPGMKSDFIVRYTGYITLPKAGDYRLTVLGEKGDQVRLKIGDRTLINEKNFNGEQEAKTTITGAAGDVMPILLEYTHAKGNATLQLHWQSGDAPRQIVPPEAFHDSWGRFITNEGKPADWWLRLARYGKELINGQRPHSPMPIP